MPKMSKLYEIHICIECSTGLMKQNPPKGMRCHPKPISQNAVVVQGQHRV